MRLAVLSLALLVSAAPAAEPPKRDHNPVELVGKASDIEPIRDYRVYYWRDDFHFSLKDEASGKTWKIISREPTPAYEWRMGPTYPGLKVDWKAGPRVKVIGVEGVDRTPTEFHGHKLDQPNLATAFVVLVETEKGKWQEFCVNNWFHKWGDRADAAVHKFYAGKKAPYDVYGFVNGQAAPFSKSAREVLTKNPKGNMFHGLIKEAPGTPFGYEIDLLHLIGRDPQGGATVFHGDPKDIPLLEKKK